MVVITEYNADSAKEGTIRGTSFADSPVVVMVSVETGDSEDERTFKKNTSSHKARIKVVCERRSGLNVGGKQEDYFEFPTENGEVIWIDIQSALRTLLGDVSSALNPNDSAVFKNGMKLPLLEYRLEATSSYMEDGLLVESSPSIMSGGLFAIRGALTDVERYRLGNKGATNESQVVLSRKPNSIETVAPGSLYVKCRIPKEEPSLDGGASIPVQQPGFMEVKTVEQVANGLYIDKERDMFQFIFVNSLGAPESACAVVRESLSYDVETNAYSRLSDIRRKPVLEHQTFSSTKVGPEVFSMSSGAVTKEWAEWWTTEFLNAKCWWMKKGDVWWPVTVAPTKKTMTIYDRTKAEALSVEFQVTLGVYGTRKSIF